MEKRDKAPSDTLDVYILDYNNLPQKAHDLHTSGTNDTFIDSFELECLYLTTYMRFCCQNMQWNIKTVCNSNISPTGKLPVLRDQNVHCEGGINNCIEYLKKQGYDLDTKLADHERPEFEAYSNIIWTVLYDALLFEWFGVKENYSKGIRPMIRSSIRGNFVTNSYMEDKLLRLQKYNIDNGNNTAQPTNTASAEKKKLTPEQFTESLKKAFDVNNEGFGDFKLHETQSLAIKYLGCLSKQLGDQDYLFGNKAGITSLDALLYAYLNLVMNIDLEKPALSTIISIKYPNLVEYFSRLRDVLILNEATRAGTTVGPIGKSLGEPSGVIEFVKNFGVMVRSSISETSSAVSRLATRIKTIVKTKDRGISLSSHGLNDAEFTKRYRFVMGSVYAALLYIAANKLFLPPEPPKRLPPPPEMLQLSSASDLMRQLFSAEGNDGVLEDLKYGKDTSGAYRKGDIEIELDSDEYDEDLLDEEYDDDHDDFDIES